MGALRPDSVVIRELRAELAEANRILWKVRMLRVWHQEMSPQAFVYADELAEALGVPTRPKVEASDG